MDKYVNQEKLKEAFLLLWDALDLSNYDRLGSKRSEYEGYHTIYEAAWKSINSDLCSLPPQREVKT